MVHFFVTVNRYYQYHYSSGWATWVFLVRIRLGVLRVGAVKESSHSFERAMIGSIAKMSEFIKITKALTTQISYRVNL